MEVAGPLGTPLGLAQQKRASPRREAGTSGFLSVSDSDRRVPAELGQESHLAGLALSWKSVLAAGIGVAFPSRWQVSQESLGPGVSSLHSLP